MGFVEFVRDRWPVLSFLAYQHMSLVVQTLVLATLIALVIGVLIYRSPAGVAVGNSVTAVGLTIPSYALLGVLVGIVGLGVVPSVILLVFFGVFPILRNVVVGLNGVDKTLIESARGMGMSRFATLIRLELPLAWPVIMTGVRISAQMLMGIAAIAAYALGPGPRRLHLLGHIPHGRGQRDQLHRRRDGGHPDIGGHLGHRVELRHPSHRP